MEGGGDSREKLRKKAWYLGEVTEEAAVAILEATPHSNSFVVYSKPGETGYTLSTRFHVEAEDVIEHLQATPTSLGQYQLPGQPDPSSGIIEVVDSYTQNRAPPLIPALGRSFQSQLSAPDGPPPYSLANTTLAPDIVPLPNIAQVSVQPVMEARTGNLNTNEPDPLHSRVPHLSNLHSPHDRNHGCLHPKNCWHCCCYRPTLCTGNWECSASSCCDSDTIASWFLWAFCAPCLICLAFYSSDDDD